MPTYRKDTGEMFEVLKSVQSRFPEYYQSFADSKLKIDLMFAYPNYDENGEPTGNDITANGYAALGKCRIVPQRDRAKGNGDAEITVDKTWWDSATEAEREALLDHEMNHIKVIKGKTDDLHRPKLKMRKHDVQVGWFEVIASRHGAHSQERQQAAQIMQDGMQFYWPEIAGTMGGRFSKLESGHSINFQSNTVTLRTASGKEVTAPIPIVKAAIEDLHRQSFEAHKKRAE
jgi:hypothetical protein